MIFTNIITESFSNSNDSIDFVYKDLFFHVQRPSTLGRSRVERFKSKSDNLFKSNCEIFLNLNISKYDNLS